MMATRLTSTSGFSQIVDIGFLSQTSPYPAYNKPEPARYTIKWGKLSARIVGSVQTEANDNINLSSTTPEADVSFGPNVRIGFVYPMSQKQLTEFNLGFGYRWYLNHPAVNSINIDPHSRLDYKVSILQSFQLVFYDSFGVTVDPTSRPDINGSSEDLLHFQRFNNRVGVMGNWQPTADLRISLGYEYAIDRSLTDSFTSIDLNTQTYYAGVYYTFSPRITAGLSGSYSKSEYVEKIQNNSDAYNIGPMAVYKPSKFITINASAGYSVSRFDTSGVITDTSQFNGFRAQLGIRHVINQRVFHELEISKGNSLGFGSNFNETFIAQYGITARMRNKITVRSTLMYENFQTSSLGGEMADRYLYYLATSYQLTRKWGIGAAYTLSLKKSSIGERDYTQNRLTLDVTRQF